MASLPQSRIEGIVPYVCQDDRVASTRANYLCGRKQQAAYIIEERNGVDYIWDRVMRPPITASSQRKSLDALKCSMSARKTLNNLFY